MKIEVPDLMGDECGDIAITAAEGGISYWARIDDYDWKRWSHEDSSMDNIEVADDFVFYTIEYENPSTYDPPTLSADVTPRTFRMGFQLALDLKYEIITRLLSIDRDDWTGEIDADAADVIVQLGVLGKVEFS
jgi:hypothetical protein